MGLMTGTSLDAIDLVLAEFIGDKKPTVLATRSHPIPLALRQALLKLCSGESVTLSSLGQIDAELGSYYAQAVKVLLAPLSISSGNICALGCHGQTVWHQPQGPWSFTLQIGDPNRLAAQTGITVVSDFRRRDVAEGGQGAPLAPAFHAALFGQNSTCRLIINIGGIANISVLNPHQPRNGQGYDTGPGNVLLDYWIEQHRGVPYDEGGAWALTGQVLPDLLDRLLSDSYFTLAPPKSTGREYFNPAWLIAHLTEGLLPADVQATLVELTAQTVVRAIQGARPKCLKVEVLLCGGGAHNQALVGAMQRLLPDVSVLTTDVFGVPADWVEALGFAWLARERMAERTIDLSGVTGARRPAPLGAVYLA